jgi:hypothetical protein
MQTSFHALDKRGIIFAGVYGFGKTEVPVNYAIGRTISQNQPVSIIDLDIVNTFDPNVVKVPIFALSRQMLKPWDEKVKAGCSS